MNKRYIDFNKFREQHKAKAVSCPYCQNDCEFVDGSIIYPHRPDLFYKNFWFCRPCDAFVGCHDGTRNAFGTPANFELRTLRRNLHLVFDKLWKDGDMTRHEAYDYLQEIMNLSKEKCHIGMFTIEQCRQAILKLNSYLAYTK